jgi:colicin import membrane protein
MSYAEIDDADARQIHVQASLNAIGEEASPFSNVNIVLPTFREYLRELAQKDKERILTSKEVIETLHARKADIVMGDLIVLYETFMVPKMTKGFLAERKARIAAAKAQAAEEERKKKEAEAERQAQMKKWADAGLEALKTMDAAKEVMVEGVASLFGKRKEYLEDKAKQAEEAKRKAEEEARQKAENERKLKETLAAEEAAFKLERETAARQEAIEEAMRKLKEQKEKSQKEAGTYEFVGFNPEWYEKNTMYFKRKIEKVTKKSGWQRETERLQAKDKKVKELKEKLKEAEEALDTVLRDQRSVFIADNLSDDPAAEAMGSLEWQEQQQALVKQMIRKVYSTKSDESPSKLDQLIYSSDETPKGAWVSGEIAEKNRSPQLVLEDGEFIVEVVQRIFRLGGEDGKNMPFMEKEAVKNQQAVDRKPDPNEEKLMGIKIVTNNKTKTLIVGNLNAGRELPHGQKFETEDDERDFIRSTPEKHPSNFFDRVMTAEPGMMITSLNQGLSTAKEEEMAMRLAGALNNVKNLGTRPSVEEAQKKQDAAFEAAKKKAEEETETTDDSFLQLSQAVEECDKQHHDALAVKSDKEKALADALADLDRD